MEFLGLIIIVATLVATMTGLTLWLLFVGIDTLMIRLWGNK